MIRNQEQNFSLRIDALHSASRFFDGDGFYLRDLHVLVQKTRVGAADSDQPVEAQLAGADKITEGVGKLSI